MLEVMQLFRFHGHKNGASSLRRRHNTQLNDTQHQGLIHDTQHNNAGVMLSVGILSVVVPVLTTTEVEDRTLTFFRLHLSFGVLQLIN